MKPFSAATSRLLVPFLAALPFLGAGSAQAVVLIANFNDTSTGGVNSKAGGTGFTGNWYGSASSNIVTGDVTSSLYNIPQGGTSLSLRNGNNAEIRQNFRTVTTSPTGEVWFSFLTRTQTSATGGTESAGISLNPSSTGTPFNNRGTFYIQMTGNNLVYALGGAENTVPITPTVANTAYDKTTLIVVRMIISPSGGADTISLWVDPDLIANNNIFAYTPVYSNSTINALDTISVLGAISYQNANPGLGGGILDNIRFSDGNGNAAQAFFDVTGVPEPTSLALAALGVGGFLFRRRK